MKDFAAKGKSFWLKTFMTGEACCVPSKYTLEFTLHLKKIT
jgi:hypothetical protein